MALPPGPRKKAKAYAQAQLDRNNKVLIQNRNLQSQLAEAKKKLKEATKPVETSPIPTYQYQAPAVQQPEVLTQPTTSQFTQEITKLIEAMKPTASSAPAPVAPPTNPTPAASLQINDGTMVSSNATGFSRKKSSARKMGTTTKGTSRLTIKPMTTNSGLNIGY